MKCPACFSSKVKNFYKQKKVPVLNNVTYDSYQEAVSCVKESVKLAFCNHCGLIFNQIFNPKKLNYDNEYDSYRLCSVVYRKYIDGLINFLIERCQIHQKKILEIGCFDGEFLKLLCQKTDSGGIGIDPACSGPAKIGQVRFIRDYFPSKKKDEIAANICILRHILEHIESPTEFFKAIRQKVKSDKDLTIIIEIPDFEWIAKEGAFWDVTYEHCNYFTKQSLAYLLRLVGVNKIQFFNTFGDQYLLVIGSFSKLVQGKNHREKPSYEIVKEFLKNVRARKRRVQRLTQQSLEPFSIWGMSGKGVIFLNLLPKKIQKRIPFVIDDSEKKQHKYSAGTGHKILSYEILKSHPVNKILVMNSNYYQEMLRKVKILKDIRLIIV